MTKIITLLLVGMSVGLSNFAASFAIAIDSKQKLTRRRMALVFGVFETGMPIVGLLIGRVLAKAIGGKANIIGGGLLGLTGLYLFLNSLKNRDELEVEKTAFSNWKTMVLSGLALSVDNLIVSFSLGVFKIPIILAALVIGGVSVLLSLIGLELGKRLSVKFDKYSASLSGLFLLFIAIAIWFKIL